MCVWGFKVRSSFLHSKAQITSWVISLALDLKINLLCFCHQIQYLLYNRYSINIHWIRILKHHGSYWRTGLPHSQSPLQPFSSTAATCRGKGKCFISGKPGTAGSQSGLRVLFQNPFSCSTALALLCGRSAAFCSFWLEIFWGVFIVTGNLLEAPLLPYRFHFL